MAALVRSAGRTDRGQAGSLVTARSLVGFHKSLADCDLFLFDTHALKVCAPHLFRRVCESADAASLLACVHRPEPRATLGTEMAR
jgi:hypothetical protein